MTDDIIETLLKHHGEIKRLSARIERLESQEQAAEIERLRAALDEITHYWSSGPVDPGWKEIASRALKETL